MEEQFQSRHSGMPELKKYERAAERCASSGYRQRSLDRLLHARGGAISVDFLKHPTQRRHVDLGLDPLHIHWSAEARCFSSRPSFRLPNLVPARPRALVTLMVGESSWYTFNREWAPHTTRPLRTASMRTKRHPEDRKPFRLHSQTQLSVDSSFRRATLPGCPNQQNISVRNSGRTKRLDLTIAHAPG